MQAVFTWCISLGGKQMKMKKGASSGLKTWGMSWKGADLTDHTVRSHAAKTCWPPVTN